MLKNDLVVAPADMVVRVARVRAFVRPPRIPCSYCSADERSPLFGHLVVDFLTVGLVCVKVGPRGTPARALIVSGFFIYL